MVCLSTRTTSRGSRRQSCACSRIGSSPRALGERRANVWRSSCSRPSSSPRGWRRSSRRPWLRVKPRVLFVGRTRYRLPLAGWLERKWSAVGRELDFHVLASADPASAGSDPRFSLLPPSGIADGALFHLRLPFRLRSAIQALRPQAIVAEDPTDGDAGDGRVRRLGRAEAARDLRGARGLAPLDAPLRFRGAAPADAARGRPRPLRRPPRRRRARAVAVHGTASSKRCGAALRTLSSRPSPTSRSSPNARSRRCPSGRPRCSSACSSATRTSTGWSQRGRSWPGSCPRRGSSSSGKGPLRAEVDALRAEVPSVEHLPELAPRGGREGARRRDAARPPLAPRGPRPRRHRGPRRGRAVVASRAGGVLDLVDDGVEGLLVDPEDTEGLAAALVRVLGDGRSPGGSAPPR